MDVLKCPSSKKAQHPKLNFRYLNLHKNWRKLKPSSANLIQYLMIWLAELAEVCPTMAWGIVDLDIFRSFRFLKLFPSR